MLSKASDLQRCILPVSRHHESMREIGGKLTSANHTASVPEGSSSDGDLKAMHTRMGDALYEVSHAHRTQCELSAATKHLIIGSLNDHTDCSHRSTTPSCLPTGRKAGERGVHAGRQRHPPRVRHPQQRPLPPPPSAAIRKAVSPAFVGTQGPGAVQALQGPLGRRCSSGGGCSPAVPGLRRGQQGGAEAV